MLWYLSASELHRHPRLRRSMFLDRADQFKVRQNWDVHVNANGEERDEYDDKDPLYLIWQEQDGLHGGSMRLMPTMGEVMVNDHFSYLMNGQKIRSDDIWEATRFCLRRNASSRVAAALMIGASEVMDEFGIERIVGVFDHKMRRIYNMMRTFPEVISSQGEGRDQVSIGYWCVPRAQYDTVRERSGITKAQLEWWREQSFGMHHHRAARAIKDRFSA